MFFFFHGKKVIAGIIVLALTGVYFYLSPKYSGGEFNFLTTSILDSVRYFTALSRPDPVDLSIENVSVRLVSNPDITDPFNRYHATIEIKNNGGSLKNGHLLLFSDGGQKYYNVENTSRGFSLGAGEIYTIRNYEITLHEDYNGLELPLEIMLTDIADNNEENNSYPISIFIPGAKIKDMKVKAISDEGVYLLDFDDSALKGGRNFYEFVSLINPKIPYKDYQYYEIETQERLYGFDTIPFNNEYVQGESEQKRIFREQAEMIRYARNPFTDLNEHYFYLKAVNPETGAYSVSDIVHLDSQEELTRAQFAKIFIDFAGIELKSEGVIYYDDIGTDAWYAPYIQTLYNMGLINSQNFQFFPVNLMSRADAMRVIMDYYDTDLTVPDGPHFFDVNMNSDFYPYIEGFYAANTENRFTDYFYPDEPVKRSFIKHLINVLKEDN